MAMVLDELVLALGIDDKSFQTGEQAVVAGLDRLTAVMENVAQAFDTGEKKNRYPHTSVGAGRRYAIPERTEKFHHWLYWQP